jgi:hypothetical protein
VELGINYPRPIIVVTQWNQQVNSHIILLLYVFGFSSFKIVGNYCKINIIRNNVASTFILKAMENHLNILRIFVRFYLFNYLFASFFVSFYFIGVLHI